METPAQSPRVTKGRGKDTEVFSFQVRRRSEASSGCVSHSWARLGVPRPPKKNASAAQAGTRATWSSRTRQAFAPSGFREAGPSSQSGRRSPSRSPQPCQDMASEETRTWPTRTRARSATRAAGRRDKIGGGACQRWSGRVLRKCVKGAEARGGPHLLRGASRRRRGTWRHRRDVDVARDAQREQREENKGRRKSTAGAAPPCRPRRRSTRRGAPPASRATPPPQSRTEAPPGRVRRTRRPRTRSPAPPARPGRASSVNPTSRSCRTACRSRAPRRDGSGPPRRPRGRGAALACVETPPLGRRRGESSAKVWAARSSHALERYAAPPSIRNTATGGFGVAGS